MNNSQAPKALSIALVINRYFDFGGLQKEMLRIAKLFIERGHQVEIISSDYEGELIAGVTRYIVPFTAKANHKKMQQLALILERRKKEKHFDTIIGFNKIPGIDFYFAGDVCLAEKIDKEKSSLVKILPRYRHYLKFEKAVFDTESHCQILLLAHGARSTYEHYYQTDPQRFHLMPPGVAKDRFAMNFDREAAKRQLRKDWQLAADANVIIHVGSAFHRKGADRIIKAMHALPEALKEKTFLFVIGDDNAKKCVALASKLQLIDHVIFTGPRNDVDQFYQGADLLVHPAREECTGMTIMEGLFCGLPVITTENCGFAWHIKNANAGHVVDYPFKQLQLNSHLEDILSLNAHLWQQLSESAQHYCLTEQVHNLSEAVVEVVENNQPKGSL